MDLNEIQQLIRFVSKSGANEVELETKDFKIVIKSDDPKKKGAAEAQPTIVAAQPQMMQPMQQMQMPQAAPVAAAAPAPAPAEKAAPADDESKYITVKAPMIGTFYRSASPDKPAFVGVGDSISEGSVTCIIEAMKLFNEIESEVSGKIVKVLVEDATPVEYDQPLFLVDPS